MFRFLLNLLLPQPPHVAALEKMTAAEFRAAVPTLPAQPREWMLPLFPYENPLVKTAVWEVKYRGNRCIARLVGALLAEELAGWLCKEDAFPQGVLLMTGTGIVPPDDFSLQAGDEVRISIEGVGTLVNTMD